MPQRTGLRKREIVFAVAAGGLAAGAAALILDDSNDGPMPFVAVAQPLNFNVAAFEEIASVGPQDVVVTVGGTQAISAEGAPEALNQFELVVEDGKLTIQPKEQFRRGFNWSRFDSLTFFVTVPRLESASLAGSGNIRVDKVEGDSFTGSIAGSGELAIAAMQVDEADFNIAGSGDVVAAGTARQARVSIGGSGEARAGGLRSQTASVSIVGSGDVELTVEDEAQIRIAGSGDVDINGPARCSISQMGSGDVNCGDVD